MSPSKKDPTKTVTYANLGHDKWVANGFDTTPVAKALKLGTEVEAPKAEPTPTVVETPTTTGLDLNALLG